MLLNNTALPSKGSRIRPAGNREAGESRRLKSALRFLGKLSMGFMGMLIISGIVGLGFDAVAVEKRLLTREEAVRMLPYSDEGNDPGEYEAFLKLFDYGEAAYPALVEELFDTRASMRIYNIVNVFTGSKGDKSLPLDGLMRFAERHGRDSPSFPGIEAVFRGLGQIGSEKEKEFLRQYLDLEDTLVRHTVEDSIKLIEKRLETLKREALRTERRERDSGHRQGQAAPGQRAGDGASGAFGFTLPRMPIGISMCLILAIVAAGGILFFKRR